MITRQVAVEVEIEFTGEEFLAETSKLDTLTLAHCSISIMTQLTDEKIKKIRDFSVNHGNHDEFFEWVESAKQFAARLASLIGEG